MIPVFAGFSINNPLALVFFAAGGIAPSSIGLLPSALFLPVNQVIKITMKISYTEYSASGRLNQSG